MGKAFQRAHVPGISARILAYRHALHASIMCTWTGGREKTPAAICRKVIQAKLSRHHEIEIWGTGNP